MHSSSSLLPVFPTTFFPSHLCLSHITIIETMVSDERCERCMSHVSSWKEILIEYNSKTENLISISCIKKES